ncbi:MAG: malonic semialdehyde reductase RutE [Chlamydiae bacterium]|nr:malonic semialdehyde reductase RutE [Chlamydiota bacterium]
MKWKILAVLFLQLQGFTMTNVSKEIETTRKTTYSVQPYIINRWSPRSMTGEAMSDDELMPLFEAARWAPSNYNSQPWRILYAKRDTPEWELFYDLLIDFNKSWCKNAAALVVMVSRDTFEKNDKPSVTHSYDTGAAWMSIALEGNARGYVVHGMSGFDFEKARETLNIPEGYTVEAMAAIGKRAPKENLPEEMQKMENPSTRKELSEIAIPGKFH